MHTSVRKLAFVPLPVLVPPLEVTLLPANGTATPASAQWPLAELPAIVMDECGAAWAGRLLAECDLLAEGISAQRRRLIAQVDEAANAAQKQVAALRAQCEAAYGPELLAWTRMHLPPRRRSVDLLTLRLGLRATGGQPERVTGPGEEAALVGWAEEHLGLDYVRREPRLEWARVKERLKAMRLRMGVDGRAVVDLIDEATGEVREGVVVPGVRIAPREDRLEVKVTGAALAAPDSDEE